MNCMCLLLMVGGIYRLISCIYHSMNGVHGLINCIDRLINGSIVIGYVRHDCCCLFVARVSLLVRCGTNIIAGQLWLNLIGSSASQAALNGIGNRLRFVVRICWEVSDLAAIDAKFVNCFGSALSPEIHLLT